MKASMLPDRWRSLRGGLVLALSVFAVFALCRSLQHRHYTTGTTHIHIHSATLNFSSSLSSLLQHQQQEQQQPRSLDALLTENSSADDAGGTELDAQTPTNNNGDAVRLFVGVLSRSKSIGKRQAIRATWGADPRLARVVFFTLRPQSPAIFKALRDEAAEHGDVVVTSEADESYHNATYSMVTMMRAAAGMGDLVTHLFKTDDDCYVRVDRLLAALEPLSSTPWLYAGRRERIRVNRNETFRWYVPRSNWASDWPITYMQGMAMALSQDLVRQLAAGAVHARMPPLNMLWIEDVAIGAWVRQIAGERRVAVAYGNLPCSADACHDDDIVTANLRAPVGEAMQCLHDNGGRCCGALTQPSGGSGLPENSPQVSAEPTVSR